MGSGLSWSADLHPMLWKVSPLFGIGKQELILGKRCMKQFWAYSTWHLFIGSISEHLSLVHLWKYYLVIAVLAKPKSLFVSSVVSHLLEKIECIFRFYFLKNDHNRTLIKGLWVKLLEDNIFVDRLGYTIFYEDFWSGSFSKKLFDSTTN